ncbi:CHORISMATE SYNTHASE [Salix purpurea]|uniref:CHORISMATE SYNTHASE n=1 Tax=Salix purpurea TaxID=77065 RepID=A0A9Q0SRC6_SALPP|nr:CHORISMATE SYNTHASE [Salix purpurea]
MSLQSEDQLGLNQYLETSNEPQKKLKISYAREFLLSLSELDICKKLPSGFDESLPSEFKDILQDRFRIPVSSSSQSSRRNDYSSSPPTRGDSGNFFRGIHGRWDSRSSGRSDRDSDSQSDWDSDSGRRYINRTRRPWQVPEHDGLLGSGSFPKPSTYAAGPSAPKFRSNDQFQLNRNNEPYQPPRPYKAVPHLHREINDSLNDETFGSSESASEDRAEEERKRRASFESMRKEQHKAFRENQKPEKSKDKFDFTELLEDSKDDKKTSE